jgi:predicted helicase
MAKLNARQQKFVDAYLVKPNATQAALDAGYSPKTAYSQGNRLLDKTALVVNPTLTLAGIPPETFQYRLGNRSALEWVIDQYQVTEDKRSGIRSDPNRADDPEYIVRLVGQVIQVSLKTTAIIDQLPEEFTGAPGARSPVGEAESPGKLVQGRGAARG